MSKSETVQRKYQEEFEQYKDLCEKNNISYRLFYLRRYKGRAAKDAASEPKWTNETRSRNLKSISQKYDPKYYQMAMDNGLSRACYYHRIREQGMTPLQAATTPDRRMKGHG
ncbi:hypothetical protein BACI349Y_560022 [Bacillus sp. 349Y]|nr:hypothetical protein BACI349Y_560022 [Bacillus sp. 349Y]